MKINEFLYKNKKFKELSPGYLMKELCPPVVCKDGFYISVQASHLHHCTPRIDDAEMYETVELGFPNMEDSLIFPYAEEKRKPTGTIYSYVPVDIVDKLIEKHGGIDDAKRMG